MSVRVLGRERERQKGEEEEVLGQALSSVRQARTAARLVHLPNGFWPGRKNTEQKLHLVLFIVSSLFFGR